LTIVEHAFATKARQCARLARFCPQSCHDDAACGEDSALRLL